MKKISVLLIIAILFSLCSPMVLATVPDTGGYIVKLKETAPNGARLMANADLDEIYADEGLYRASSIQEIEALGDAVEYYEKDAIATLSTLTEDRLSSKQWDLEYTRADAAWNKDYTGEGIRIAVIDSGVNSMHEDFDGVLFEKGSNILDGSHDVTDEMGHGTFITGTIAAKRNNGLGIAGLCDDAVIIPIKCFDKQDSDLSYIIEGIYEAVDVYNCDVLNMSLGSYDNRKAMREAVDYAASKGVIIVSAVGNQGGPKLQYPAAYQNVVGVGSIDKQGEVCNFSQENSSVFITAPGTRMTGLDYEGNDRYTTEEGTSCSAAIVAAAAIYMKERNKNATIDDFKLVLERSARDAGAVGYDTSYGHGILDFSTYISAMETHLDKGGTPVTPTTAFDDIDDHWAEASIIFCVDRAYFNGVSETKFEPETAMSRAMFVTALSRMSGETISGYENAFNDVPDDAYYAQAAAWGNKKGIVLGYGNGHFGPEENVSREHMALFLHRYAKAYGLDTTLSSTAVLDRFTDKSDVTDDALLAMAWAVESGLISGRTTSTLVPQGNAIRAEVTTIIQRFAVKYDIE